MCMVWYHCLIDVCFIISNKAHKKQIAPIHHFICSLKMWRSLASSLAVVLSFVLDKAVSVERNLQNVDNYLHFGQAICAGTHPTDPNDVMGVQYEGLRYNGAFTAEQCGSMCPKTSGYVAMGPSDNDCECYYNAGTTPSGYGEDEQMTHAIAASGTPTSVRLIPDANGNIIMDRHCYIYIVSSFSSVASYWTIFFLSNTYWHMFYTHWHIFYKRNHPKRCVRFKPFD